MARKNKMIQIKIDGIWLKKKENKYKLSILISNQTVSRGKKIKNDAFLGIYLARFLSYGCRQEVTAPWGHTVLHQHAAFVLGSHFGATLSSFQYLLQWRFLATRGLQTGKKFIPALQQTSRQLQGAKRRFSGSPEALGIDIFLLKINAGGGKHT